MASNNSLASANLSFTPPPFLKSPDCMLAAAWLATPNDTIESVVTMMDDMCHTTESDEPTAGQWIGWYLSSESDEYVVGWVDYTVTNCTKPFCEELKWEGNSDLAGRGMMITYWLEGVLACIYALFICAESYIQALHRRKGSVMSKFLSKLSAAIGQSSVDLLSTMLLFCVAMLAATLYGYADAMRPPKKGITEAERVSFAFMATFSIFPPVLVQSVLGPLRREKFRFVLWFTIYVLVVAVRVLAEFTPTLDVSAKVYKEESQRKLSFETYCAANTEQLWIALAAFEIAAAASIILWFSLKISWTQRLKIVKICRSVWWRIPFALSFSGIWIFLGIFAAYRKKQGKMSGDSNKELAWGFGQILALATWAQPILDAIYIFVFGAEEGLEGRISKNFRVIAAKNGSMNTGTQSIRVAAKTDHSLESLLPTDG
ncbi:hypothetical protein BCR34DRAFT_600755 [Clohesyomyces aquaticus]|uniref:Uncharacterized protein n=1 Tax=Clohesyomyces aquaticus TaxID=1231657 RepID=A0A1Y1ZPM8_9PLEO|nr:hypothetical protein BCR34DRAFT_600755 [Clohesyomyces aquaticus]